MDQLVRFLIHARAAVRSCGPTIATVLLAVGLVVDLTNRYSNRWRMVLVGLYVLLLAASVLRRWRRGTRRPHAWNDAQLGGLLALGLIALAAHVDASLDGPTYALVYALLVASSVLTPTSATAAIAAFCVGIEAAVRFVSFGESSPFGLAVHATFLALFGVLGMVVLRAEIARVRQHSRNSLEAEIERFHNAARSYRLLEVGRGSSAGDPAGAASPGDSARLVCSSVEEIHQAILFALDLLRRSLGLHTAILLWLSDSGTHLRISELSTDEDGVCEGPFSINDGIVGAAAAERRPITASGLKPSYAVPYYRGACPVRALAAVPVLDGDHLRGVLLADRRENIPFSEVDLELLTAATRYVLRAIHNERVFVQLERAKVEQGKLYRAARALGGALTEREVVQAIVRSAREIASFDFAAVTVFDSAKRVHEVRAVSGEGADDLVGTRFAHNAGLVAMVVQNLHPLPYKGDFDPARQVLFARRVPSPQMPSLLVLPLIVHDRPLGTLVLGAKRRAAFGDAVRPSLEVLASHLAVSLDNARMVKRLEELATSDGLTGLYNKRAMLEFASAKLAAAKRFQRPLSVLIVDVDHFKAVNDTYGHDIGDVVLRGLADVLRRNKRTTDLVGRFGGEEFVLLCEQTDQKGAMLLAERIREELARTAFHSPKGPLSVTCSVGIATSPEAGELWETLFKAADDALYLSKRSGRNRSTCSRRRSPASRHAA